MWADKGDPCRMANGRLSHLLDRRQSGKRMIADNDTLMGAARHPNVQQRDCAGWTVRGSLARRKCLTRIRPLAVTVERHSDYYRHFTEAYVAFFDGATSRLAPSWRSARCSGRLTPCMPRWRPPPGNCHLARHPLWCAAGRVSVVSEAMLLALAGGVDRLGPPHGRCSTAWQKAFFNNIFRPGGDAGTDRTWYFLALAVARSGRIAALDPGGAACIVDALRAT